MASASPSAELGSPGSSLSPRGWAVLGLVVVLVNLPLIHYHFVRRSPSATVRLPFTDAFATPDALKSYRALGGHWRIVNGELLSPGVRNNPLWLSAELPRDVAIEFDARSESYEGDIKVEVFGNGLDHASGYVLIHGGWNNSISVIARLDEHGKSLSAVKQAGEKLEKGSRVRAEAHPFRVETGKTYRWRIERKGNVLKWLIDGQPFMELDDPYPLGGKGHDRFGFSSWDAQLYFDNLKVEPL